MAFTKLFNKRYELVEFWIALEIKFSLACLGIFIRLPLFTMHWCWILLTPSIKTTISGLKPSPITLINWFNDWREFHPLSPKLKTDLPVCLWKILGIVPESGEPYPQTVEPPKNQIELFSFWPSEYLVLYFPTILVYFKLITFLLQPINDLYSLDSWFISENIFLDNFLLVVGNIICSM